MKRVTVHPPRQVHMAITIDSEVNIIMGVEDVIGGERRFEDLPQRVSQRSPSNNDSLIEWIARIVRVFTIVSSKLLIADGVEVVSYVSNVVHCVNGESVLAGHRIAVTN